MLKYSELKFLVFHGLLHFLKLFVLYYYGVVILHTLNKIVHYFIGRDHLILKTFLFWIWWKPYFDVLRAQQAIPPNRRLPTQLKGVAQEKANW